jgi:REP element-mobilizing transposase RayT
VAFSFTAKGPATLRFATCGWARCAPAGRPQARKSARLLKHRWVADALRHFHDRQYLLDEWVVMPNHVHVLLWPMPNFTLSEILKSRKRHTARQANLILGRTGETFWQRESYDHWIRNDEEKARIRRYIRMNPATAGLCKAPEDWKWSSAWPGWKTAARPPT